MKRAKKLVIAVMAVVALAIAQQIMIADYNSMIIYSMSDDMYAEIVEQLQSQGIHNPTDERIVEYWEAHYNK